MAIKKTFKDNPALRFISGPENTSIDEHLPSPVPEALANVDEEVKKPVKTVKKDPVKKTAPVKLPNVEKAPEGYKLNPLYVETKTRRVQLVFQPSVLERVKAKASESGLSLNEFCHRILDEATKD